MDEPISAKVFHQFVGPQQQRRNSFSGHPWCVSFNIIHHIKHPVTRYANEILSCLGDRWNRKSRTFLCGFGPPTQPQILDMVLYWILQRKAAASILFKYQHTDWAGISGALFPTVRGNVSKLTTGMYFNVTRFGSHDTISSVSVECWNLQITDCSYFWRMMTVQLLKMFQIIVKWQNSGNRSRTKGCEFDTIWGYESPNPSSPKTWHASKLNSK